MAGTEEGKSPVESPDLASGGVQREDIAQTMRELYARYYHHAMVSTVGAAGVAGLYAQIGTDDVLRGNNPLVIALVLVLPVLAASWAAGWAYLNVELWAYRNYLAYLDMVGRTGKRRVLLHSDVFRRGVYGAIPRWRFFGKKAATAHLTLLVGMFPLTIAFGSLVLAVIMIWTRWERWGHLVAVLYGLGMAFMYVYVFVAKVSIDQAVQRILWDEKERKGGG